jgi:hypothetical protein
MRPRWAQRGRVAAPLAKLHITNSFVHLILLTAKFNRHDRGPRYICQLVQSMGVRLIRAALGGGMLFATQAFAVARTFPTRFFKEQNYDNESES